MTERRHWSIRYGFALAAVVAGTLLRVTLTSLVGPGLATYITFYPVVMVVALMVGEGPGLLATAAVVVITDVLFISPQSLFLGYSPEELLGQIIFVLMGAFMTYVAARYRQIRDNLEGLVANRTRELNDSNDSLKQQIELVNQAKEALQESEDRLRFSLTVLDVGEWDLNLIDNTAHRSLRHDQIFGYETLLPQWTLEKFLEHVVPEDRASVEQKFKHAIESKSDWDFECRIIRKDGIQRWISAKGQHRFNPNGQARKMAGIVQDITERKKAEEELFEATAQRQAAQYARTLLETSLDPLVTISAQGKITDVNEATIRATGAPRQELIGTDYADYFTEPEKAREGYLQAFAMGYVTDYPLTIRHRNGTLMDVLYNASLYKDAQGNVQGVFAAARDVTLQKKAEDEIKRHRDNLALLVRERTAELEEANKDLIRSNENLEQFAYVASHDLQEPLRVMANFSQLLERRYKGQMDKDADEFIGFIVDAAGRMQRLITDLLAYSRAGHRGAEVSDVDFGQVVDRLVTGMARTIESADGTVTHDKLPTITANETSIGQLFQNLIGNALKFRSDEPPKIHISARKDGNFWLFTVADNGIGMEKQYLQRIFMIFQRLNPREKYEGTGIGLSICKKIVENLGGRIWVESELRKGSTFYFTIPIGGMKNG